MWQMLTIAIGTGEEDLRDGRGGVDAVIPRQDPQVIISLKQIDSAAIATQIPLLLRFPDFADNGRDFDGLGCELSDVLNLSILFR